MNPRLIALASALLLCTGTALAQPVVVPKKDKDKEKIPLKKIEPKKDAPANETPAKKDAKPAATPAGQLVVGAAAPKLSGEKWIKGQEVKEFEQGKVYVVEFWATWCGPCIDNIPHLTKLQKKHKDLTIIGMAASESPAKGSKDDREEKLSKFVKGQGTKMDYRVCFDSDRSMSKEWMEPAKQGGIPCAFVVDGEGKLAYIGHPANKGFETTIEKALADAKAAPAKKKAKPDEEGTPKEEKKKTGFLNTPAWPIVASTFAFEPPAQEGTKAEPKPANDDDVKPAKAKKAKGPVLSAGDKAPELAIEEWIQGEAVTGFEKGKVYVVEFWATWCPPCRDSIPHLSELNTRFKDKGVTVIGVSDETSGKVKPFVQKLGDKMNYSVAIDKKRGTSKAFMEAAGQDGIPSAFVVDRDGKIAWIGHPMDGLDRVVGLVVEGKFDAKKEVENGRKISQLRERLADAFSAEEWDKVLTLVDELSALDPGAAAQLSGAKFRALLVGKKDYAAAYALAGRLAEKDYKDNAQGLNELAWTIVDEPGIEKRDFELALRLANRSNEVAKGNDAAILDTVARCHFELKDYAKAVEVQTKAVDKADRAMKSELKATLEKYQAAAKK